MKKYLISLFFAGVFLMAFDLKAQTVINEELFLYDTKVFENGYWEAEQDGKIYILKFKIVLRTIDKTLNMFPENSQIKYISSPLTVKQNGIKIFEENDRQFPLYSDEYQTDKEIKMRYFNVKWKEKGTVVLAIDPNNPDKMTWSYTTRDKIGGNIGDPTFNRGVQKTPTHLVFYRKTE
ncbi:hypothetical protein [Bacteroides heparinolyticus]|uniref:hypothetical protein n=1 Tax=Prevotella heparinolytica TaxID=28113 RepID=UPI00359FD22C